LAFSDFRLIAPFVEHCGTIVGQLGCGTLTKASAHQGARYPHSQGSTLECLIDKMVNVPKDAAKAEIVKGMSKECRQQVMRIAELQSEDFHMDRPLYFACREDREVKILSDFNYNDFQF
jgi:Golgi apparatus protein 1